MPSLSHMVLHVISLRRDSTDFEVFLQFITTRDGTFMTERSHVSSITLKEAANKLLHVGLGVDQHHRGNACQLVPEHNVVLTFAQKLDNNSLVGRQSILSPVDGAVVLPVHVLQHRVLQGGSASIRLCFLGFGAVD